MVIVKFVPHLPLMAQVAEKHMYAYKFCKLAYNTIFFNDNYLELLKEISHHFHVYISNFIYLAITNGVLDLN